MFVLEWKNKYSGETGFVKNVVTKEKHFVNTFDKSEAKQYKTESTAKRALNMLDSFGETQNNHIMITEC